MSRSTWVTIGLIVTLVLAFPAAAGAQGNPGGGGHGGGGGGNSTPTGNDVSYPQCSKRLRLPTSPAFAIVGVNGGLANDLNPCLGPSASYPSYGQSELYWATADAAGGTTEANVQLYVNTADPGNVYKDTLIADWPESGTTPYGTCTTTTVTIGSGTYPAGENSDACAWQYGYDMAAQDTAWLRSAADTINSLESTVPVSDSPAGYPWWLDVETANTWQSDTTMNVADLQGMIAALQADGVTAVGAYSTSPQWNAITGGTTTSASGSLFGIPNWIPGATSLTAAQTNCGLSSFTNGTVAIAQWTGTVDNDYACP